MSQIHDQYKNINQYRTIDKSGNYKYTYKPLEN